MHNGILKPATLPATSASEFRGTFSTFTLAAPIRAVPRGVQADTRDPTHDLLMQAPHGGWVPAGLAWAKTQKRGDRAGEILLSCLVYVPDVMEREMSAAAFPRDNGEWHFQIERPRRPAGPAANDAPPAGPEEYGYAGR